MKVSQPGAANVVAIQRVANLDCAPWWDLMFGTLSRQRCQGVPVSDQARDQSSAYVVRLPADENIFHARYEAKFGLLFYRPRMARRYGGLHALAELPTVEQILRSDVFVDSSAGIQKFTCWTPESPGACPAYAKLAPEKSMSCSWTSIRASPSAGSNPVAKI